MEISNILLNIISCPTTGDKLIYDRDNQELISIAASLAYPIMDSIPILLASKARKISSKNYAHLRFPLKDEVVKNDIEA